MTSTKSIDDDVLKQLDKIPKVDVVNFKNAVMNVIDSYDPDMFLDDSDDETDDPFPSGSTFINVVEKLSKRHDHDGIFYAFMYELYSAALKLGKPNSS